MDFLDPSNSIGDLSITTISTQNTGDSGLIDLFSVSLNCVEGQGGWWMRGRTFCTTRVCGVTSAWPAKAIEKTPRNSPKKLAYNYITHILIGTTRHLIHCPRSLSSRPTNQKCLPQRVIAIHSLSIEAQSDQRVKFCYVRIFRTCTNRSGPFANRTL